MISRNLLSISLFNILMVLAAFESVSLAEDSKNQATTTLSDPISVDSPSATRPAVPNANTCNPVVPVPPNPLPANFDWTPLANDWCAQLAACGYDVSNCVSTYVALAKHPLTTPTTPGPNDNTVSSNEVSRRLSCKDSEEFKAGKITCPSMQVRTSGTSISIPTNPPAPSPVKTSGPNTRNR